MATMAVPLEELKNVISELVRVEGVEGVVISTIDGLPLVSTLGDRDLEERIAALTAVLSEVGARTSVELGKGEPSWISIHSSDGSGVIVLKVADLGYLSVLFSKNTRLGVLLYALKSTKGKLEKLLK